MLANSGASSVSITEARTLDEEESLRVRKVLACTARMQGRFGKGVLALTLRGSRSAKVTQAGLDRLSTYGILGDLTHDEIVTYIDALVAAGCLHVAPGTYPTVALTAFGGEVMREQATVKLALPEHTPAVAVAPRVASGASVCCCCREEVRPASRREHG